MQFGRAAEFALMHSQSNIYNLDTENVISELVCSKEFAETFAVLYKDVLFSRVGFLIHTKVNQIPVNSFNQWLAYDNVTVPVAVNSVTFKAGDPEAQEVRKNLSEVFGI